MTDWTQEFKKAGALWLHHGDHDRPHALLTSGLHSDGFVNCTYITMRPTLIRRILMEGLRDKFPHEHVDWVFGSPMGAITFAYAIAERLECKAGFTEKDGEYFALKRFQIKTGESILLVEDVISTGSSTRKTISAIKEAAEDKGKMLPYVLCLVNRSGKKDLDGLEIRSLLDLKINTWEPDACPLCKEGSRALRPKTHWNELIGF